MSETTQELFDGELLPELDPVADAELMEDIFPYADKYDLSEEDRNTRRTDPVPPNQFKYIGQALTADEFTRYVETYNFGVNPPSFIVLHHTAIPYTLAAPYPGKSLNGAWDAREQGLSEAQIKQRRLRKVHGMKEYYRTNVLWDRGPHLFIDERYIYLFTPMYDEGIHAGKGNWYRSNGRFYYSIGIEVIGDYTRVKWPPAVEYMVGHTLAVLKKQLGTFELVSKPWAGGISSHRNYGKPACPGNAIPDDYFIRIAKEGWARLNAPATAKAATSNLNVNSPIKGPASGSRDKIAAYLRRRLVPHSEYTSSDIDLILGYYWKYAPQMGIDPYLAAIQSVYETDAWRGYWAGRPRRNPANLGVTTSSGRQSFASWNLSVQAHLRMLEAWTRSNARTLGDLNYRWNNTPDHAAKVIAKAREVEAE